MKRIKFNEVHNFRDLGGMPIDLSKQTSHGYFFRSDLIHKLSEDELGYLKTLKIKHIIDLRTSHEVNLNPNQLATHSDYHYHHLSFLNNEELIHDLGDFNDFYRHLLHNTTILPRVFELFAQDEPVVFHCTAGKDRTGILSALLLMLGGVDSIDIIADYQLSDTYLKPLKETFKRLYPEMPIQMAGTLPEWIECVLEEVNELGGIQTYLIKKGVNKAHIDAVQRKLVQDV